MSLSKRMELLTPYRADKVNIPPGFAPQKTHRPQRVGDLCTQIFSNSICYLLAACGNLCNFRSDTPAQSTLFALTPIANSCRISQRISQLLYPELDEIWPALDGFSRLMDLELTELEQILSQHFRDSTSTQSASEVLEKGDAGNCPAKAEVALRVIQQLQWMLLAMVRSYHWRFLSIFHLQCASLCTTVPSLAELASKKLVRGLSAAVMTHSTSAQSAAVAGLVLFPTGAKGSIIALVHVQNEIIEKLSGDEFADQRRSALIALQNFYMARAGETLVALWTLVNHHLKITGCISFFAVSLAKICKAARQLAELICSFFKGFWNAGDMRGQVKQKEPARSTDLALKGRLQPTTQKTPPTLSPRQNLDAQIEENTLEILEGLFTPVSSPNGKGSHKVAPHTDLKPTRSRKSATNVKRSRSSTSLFSDKENKRPCQTPGKLYMGPTEWHFLGGDALVSKASLKIPAEWGIHPLNSRMRP